MSACQFETLLDAYHDGELNARESDRLARHVRACRDCDTELREMRRLSGLLADLRPRGITPIQRERLHESVDGKASEPILRIVKFMAAAAASILIVASAWLWELPRPARPIAQGPTTVVTPEWQHVAMTLEGDPPPDAFPETRFAGGKFTDWMIEALNEKHP